MAYSCVEVVTGILLPFSEILLPSLAVRALLTASLSGEELLGLAVCMAAIVLLYFIQGLAKKQCVWRYSYLMQGSAHDLLAHFYHAEYAEIRKELGRYRKLRGQMDSNTANTYKSTLLACKNIVIGVTGSIFYLLFLGGAQWYLIVLVLLTGAVQFFLMRLAGNYEFKNKGALDQSRREYEYLLQAGSDAAHGKEVRLFKMQPWLSDRTDQAFSGFKGISRKIKSAHTAAEAGSLSVEFIRDAAVYASMIFLAVRGYFTIDYMLFYVGIMRGLSAFVRRMLEGVRSLKKEGAVIWDIRSFLGEDSASLDDSAVDKTVLAKELPPSIEFCNVTFGYEGNENLYRNFNLKIEAGEKLAIVGVNGAGKRIDAKCRRGLFSAVFQEYFVLPATLAENVAPLNPTDTEGILSCLEQVGLKPVLESKKAGPDSKMANVGGQGLVFSGGEQQKLLLARAVYKDAPILILDEPTSALDPVAEKQVYESYRQFAGNKTSLFISHRLASTRFCDKICLLDHGKIAEYGTHKALMEQKGLYYTMFEAQSRAYRKEGADEEK